MGAFLASRAAAFRWDIFLLCVLTTIFLQILSNLANDYGDSVHGADSEVRTGPARVVQSGVITSGHMRQAIILFAGLSLVTGVVLLLVSFGAEWRALFFFLALGLLCIGAAITYTVGRRPYGYAGLGDLSVLIFFGLVGVLGSFYLFTRSVAWVDVLPASGLGLLSVGVLNVNNIRDIDSDKLAGKYSIPVRIGRSRAVAYHWVLLMSAPLLAIAYTFATYESPWQFLFLLVTPLLVRNGMAVATKPSHALDPWLRQLAISTLLFVVAFGTGMLV